MSIYRMWINRMPIYRIRKISTIIRLKGLIRLLTTIKNISQQQGAAFDEPKCSPECDLKTPSSFPTGNEFYQALVISGDNAPHVKSESEAAARVLPAMREVDCRGVLTRLSEGSGSQDFGMAKQFIRRTLGFYKDGPCNTKDYDLAVAFCEWGGVG
jgi:hypothetical protein